MRQKVAIQCNYFSKIALLRTLTGTLTTVCTGSWI